MQATILHLHAIGDSLVCLIAFAALAKLMIGLEAKTLVEPSADTPGSVTQGSKEHSHGIHH
jgi:hypothetical protein